MTFLQFPVDFKQASVFLAMNVGKISKVQTTVHNYVEGSLKIETLLKQNCFIFHFDTTLLIWEV